MWSCCCPQRATAWGRDCSVSCWLGAGGRGTGTKCATKVAHHIARSKCSEGLSGPEGGRKLLVGTRADPLTCVEEFP